MLDPHDVQQLCQGRHGDPFAVLGAHPRADGSAWLAVFLPGATQVAAVAPDAGSERLATLQQRDAAGLFEGALPAKCDYRLQVRWADGTPALIDDPYRFGAVLGEIDTWLLAEGSHLRPFEILGAAPREHEGVAGCAFAVWAPNAMRVSVVGDFNHWDGRRHPMRLRRECGVWEIFVPGVPSGARYKFELLDRGGALLPHKVDPYARQAELRPASASVVAQLPPLQPASLQRQRANALDAPISIYEVHLGSWRRKPEHGNRWLSWDELADELVPYAAVDGDPGVCGEVRRNGMQMTASTTTESKADPESETGGTLAATPQQSPQPAATPRRLRRILCLDNEGQRGCCVGRDICRPIKYCLIGICLMCSVIHCC